MEFQKGNYEEKKNALTLCVFFGLFLFSLFSTLELFLPLASQRRVFFNFNFFSFLLL